MITYSNKDILKSFIGNNRVVKKYLNNKVVYGTPDFTQYYNIQDYNDYNVTGNPTINNGIISNLDQLNYIYLPQKVQSISGFDSLNVHTVFKTSALAAASVVFGIGPYNLKLTVRSERQFWFQYRPLSAPNTLQSDKSNTMDIPLNTDLTVDLEYIKDTSAHLIIKNGDEVLWEDITTDITLTGNDDFIFGTDVLYFPGTYLSIDLNRTFVKVNNKYIFNGNPNYKELLDCNPNVYLINNSDAYINTGLNTISTMNVNTKFTFPDNVVRDLFGSSSFYITKSSNANKINFGYSGSSYKSLGSATETPLNGICIAYYKNSEIGVNGLTNTINRNFDSNEIQLFKKYSRTGKNWLGKVYYLELFDGDTLIRKFVPVPEGLKIGYLTVPYNSMFDIVTQTFYEKQGTGDFTWGVDL